MVLANCIKKLTILKQKIILSDIKLVCTSNFFQNISIYLSFGAHFHVYFMIFNKIEEVELLMGAVCMACIFSDLIAWFATFSIYKVCLTWVLLISP